MSEGDRAFGGLPKQFSEPSAEELIQIAGGAESLPLLGWFLARTREIQQFGHEMDVVNQVKSLSPEQGERL